MEFEEAIGNTKWAILESLSRGERAASEIAEETGASIANVSQQAKLLEAYGLIAAAKGEPQKGAAGKPKRNYALAKELAFVAAVREGFAGKKTLKMDELHAAVLNVWFYERQEDHYFLQKLLWQQEDLVKECLSLAVIDANAKELHLLVVAEQEKLDDLRKRFSKICIRGPDGKEKNAISWTHSPEELEEGLAIHDAYFTKLLAHPHIIIDRKGALRQFIR